MDHHSQIFSFFGSDDFALKGVGIAVGFPSFDGKVVSGVISVFVGLGDPTSVDGFLVGVPFRPNAFYVLGAYASDFNGNPFP